MFLGFQCKIRNLFESNKLNSYKENSGFDCSSPEDCEFEDTVDLCRLGNRQQFIILQ